MNSYLLRGLVFLLVVSVGASSVSAQEVPASLDDEQLLHADLLYLRGDYYRSISSYEAFLLSEPTDVRRARVHLKIAWIYSLAGKPNAAADILALLAREESQEVLGWWSRLWLADTAMDSGHSLRARRGYESVIVDCQARRQSGAIDSNDGCVEMIAYARFGLSRYFAKNHQFDRSAEQLRQVPLADPRASQARKVADYVDSLAIPSKDPLTAGLLSVVPGLGHAYLGEYKIALVAFLWNGAFLYGAADSFYRGDTGQGVLLSLVESIWYAGTIFGSVAGAHRFNRDAKDIVNEGVERDLDRMVPRTSWSARFPVPYPVLLQLKADF
jgi:hypothetical protein